MSRVLIIDVETAPALVYTWGLWNQNIGLNQIVSPSRILCFAAKFLGEREIYFHSEWGDGSREMFLRAHELLSDADAVVGYNSDTFDLRKLQGEFLLQGLVPPPPPTSIDLLKAVKKFGFQSNKLAYVGPLLHIGRKVKHEGFELWTKVLDGDPKARERMEKYNVGDVILTEKLYNKLRPFLHNHPRLSDQPGNACGACGSTKLHSRGHRRTKAFKIQRLQCQSCGAWSDGTRSKI